VRSASLHPGTLTAAALRHAVDIGQAARNLQTADDARHFERLVACTGARLAAKTGLALAGRLFNEPRCFDIARAFDRDWRAPLAHLLIDKSVVLSTATTVRAMHA
jgi:hypothetical protein